MKKLFFALLSAFACSTSIVYPAVQPQAPQHQEGHFFAAICFDFEPAAPHQEKFMSIPFHNKEQIVAFWDLLAAAFPEKVRNLQINPLRVDGGVVLANHPFPVNREENRSLPDYGLVAFDRNDLVAKLALVGAMGAPSWNEQTAATSYREMTAPYIVLCEVLNAQDEAAAEAVLTALRDAALAAPAGEVVQEA